MTITIITPDTSIITTSGDGLALTWGDMLTLLPGAYVGTTAAGEYGIALTGNSSAVSSLNILGTVTADQGGIFLHDDQSGLVDVAIGASGVVLSRQSAIRSEGASTPQTLTLHNDGQITASASSAIWASNTNLTVVNTGLISGLHNGAAINATGTGTWVDILNSGTITGGILATSLVPSLIEIENSGLISGNVTLGSASGEEIWLRNPGRISGAVTIYGSTGEQVTLDLRDGVVADDVSVLTAGALNADFSGARIGGYLSLTGLTANASLDFDGARIAGNLFLLGTFPTLDLDGIHLRGQLSLSGPGSTIRFASGQIGYLSTTTGNDTIDTRGGTVRGGIWLGSGSDTLTAGDSRDTVYESLGNDRTSLGGGDDTVALGLTTVTDGDDDLAGGAGIDTLDFSFITSAHGHVALSGAIRVSLEEGLQSGTDPFTISVIGRDTISGFENVLGTEFADSLTGDAKANLLDGASGNDTLSGLGGADTLRGGVGVDRLAGGAGADLLWGGLGVDTFELLALSDSGTTRAARDQIMDFYQTADLISLSALDANDTLAGNQAFTFAGNTTTSGTGTLRFFHDGGNTVIQLNTDADNGAESTLFLRGTFTLLATDFLL